MFGGLTKLGLDLSNQKTKPGVQQSRQDQEIEPLVISGMHMPANDGWTYHPPPAK